MSLLVKIPTRERGFEWFRRYLDLRTDPETHFLFSLDEDSPQPIPDFMRRADVTIITGKSKNKVHAYNRDINEFPGNWTVLLGASDDMEPLAQGYDRIILQDMKRCFWDTDGCLWYDTEDLHLVPHINAPKGSQDFLNRGICMLPVIGRKYYDRFGYIYHSDYNAFSCDDEQTRVAQRLNRIRYIQNRIIQHNHPSWAGKQPPDDLYNKANQFFQTDRRIFTVRQNNGFPARNLFNKEI